VSLVARTDPSRGRSQRLLLVSVGTTFCTDNQFDHDGKQDAGTSGATGDSSSKFRKRPSEVLTADGCRP
jgi:hypothetical protein